jgi:hypothetical protein
VRGRVPNTDSVGRPIKAPLQGGGAPLLRLAPARACGSYAYGDRHVEVGEAELVGGGGNIMKLRELNMMRLLVAKVSPLVSADDWPIRVGNIFWHANDPLLGTPTVVVSKNQRTIDLCSVVDASTDSLRMVNHMD